jgi:ribonuclease HI
LQSACFYQTPEYTFPAMEHNIIVYTDGACSGNPGPGGYGIVLQSGKHYKELSAGYRKTTNNRMELLAVIIALESLRFEGSRVKIFTDSKYVCEAVEKGWLFTWEKNRFKNKKNPDLWMRFLEVYRKHKVKIQWIKGHADNVFNEKCDLLAVEAAKSKHLLIDEAYEMLEQ